MSLWLRGHTLKMHSLGKGSNAQENCYILHSRLEGADVTGSKSTVP